MGSGRDERLRVKAETVRNRRSRLRRCNGATTHEPQEGRHRPRPRGGEEILGYEEERTPPGPRAPGSHAADPDKVVAQSSRAPKGPHPVHKPSAHEEREERWTSGLRPRRPGAGGAGPAAPPALGRTATNRGPVGGEARDHLLPRGGGGVRRNDEVDQVRAERERGEGSRAQGRRWPPTTRTS